MKHLKKFRTVVGYNEKKPTKILPVIKYEILHMFCCMLCITGSYLMFHNFLCHTIFCLSLIGISCYNGSVKYFKMMIDYYEKSLLRVLKEMEGSKKDEK